MSVTFVVVPQWQGSGSSRAMRLVDGAAAIQGDLPAASTRVVDVPLEAGDEQTSGIARYSSLLLVRESLRETLANVDGTTILIGGDCSTDLGAIERAIDQADGPIALLWFDAHGDLHTAESSTSAAFQGMVLRTILGDGPVGLLPRKPLTAAQVVLAGTRSLDDAEDEYLDTAGIPRLGAAELDTPGTLVAALEATGAASVYIHIDLDVLDPAVITGVSQPEPFGISLDTLMGSIRAVRARFPLAGAAITEFAPASPDEAADDLPTILRIIGALTA